MFEIPYWMSMTLQNSNSPIMEFLTFFYDLTMILGSMILIQLMILMFLNKIMTNFCLMFPESQSLEDFWLMIPIVFLFFIGFPSIKNLYLNEELNDSDMNLKVFGHQWYWSYEINFNNMFTFDGIMNKENFNFRLMETFNHLIIPMKCLIQLLVSSSDVIHSWTIPCLGIKMDATPGRISQGIIISLRPMIMLGQCSEICGSNHSFMPIFISSNSLKNFIKLN